jgi:hypothetical protein
LSSRAKPPAGSLAAAVEVVTTSFFSTREVEAKVKDSVTTAAPAMRSNILVFISIGFTMLYLLDSSED